MGNTYMEASQINYRGGETKMSVEEALKNTSGEAAAIAALQTAVGNLQSGKADMSVIAPAFSAETAYAVGDIVAYEGATYRCTTAHTGEWDETDFTATTISGEIETLSGDVSDLNSTKANQITIAPFFSADTAYDPGDLVYYNGLTYRCTNAHEGAWDASDFAATTIAGELNTLNSKLIRISSTETRTTGASGSVVLTAQTGRHVLGVRFKNMGAGKSYVYELGQAGNTVYLHITDEAGVAIASEEITYEYVYIDY